MTGALYKKYNKNNAYSYSFGTYPTFELLKMQSENVECILIHSFVKKEIREKIKKECNRACIPLIQKDRLIEKLRDKESCLLIGVMKKYKKQLEKSKNHVVLVNPSDAGNLGTIIRSCIGFGIDNLAIIGVAADIFNPKTVRASMGALFHMNFQYFADFSEYREMHNHIREYYPFMIDGKYRLDKIRHKLDRPYSLIFGNEASGLDESYKKIGKSIFIPHTQSIDSLNLSLAVGIGVYEFMKLKDLVSET